MERNIKSYIFIIAIAITVYELNLWPPRLKTPPLVLMLIYQAVMGMIITNAAYVVVWERIDYMCCLLCFYCAAGIQELNEYLGLDFINDVANWLESECACDMLSTLVSIIILLWLLVATDTTCHIVRFTTWLSEKIQQLMQYKRRVHFRPENQVSYCVLQNIPPPRRRNTDRS
ncbi:hypothetical protein L9F63_017406 [Diploptera punctata]|uniref:Uncharacterized protein n=1 Tax=Diploptera punctata TaxID=6984 RepID=A0AAD7ZZ76_DIPPU|nr:hypothetical protein L9F63_017406 [Diploptera punctata]